ncbi:probable ubiquitin carboxyl-terminal hydrolase creB [Xiphias gladius]|uniref:probable ubiquitin carboxyl-terminal hydrolase creB n=1 Tax=Xiphias gladius TaxID=8245 RepID=UPI001A99B9EB|nr:probable ubiquitin carboxyl-terminal hydrolase creB [Xiphias gladius]
MTGRDGVSPPADRYHGLFNQGATCYLNSVLQVLFMTKDFREAVERLPCADRDTERLDPHLKALFVALKRGTANTVRITKTLGIKRVWEQRDAAEYFEKILSRTSPEASQIFQGLLTHKDTCSTCGTETKTDGPFWNLPIALADSDNQDYYCVMDGIEKFFRASDASGDNQLYCDHCDAKADVTNKFEIKRHPDVLMLLLKRFTFDYRLMRHVKTKCNVKVPYTLRIPENQTYELYAFVEHFGSLKGGHYTATVKSQDENDEMWYNFNDTCVTSLDQQPFQAHNDEKSQYAYLLFYRKTTMPAAETSTDDTSEVSTPEHEHQQDKQEHYGLKRKMEEKKVVIGDEEEEDRTGADEREKEAGSAELLTSAYHECQDSRKVVAEEQSSGRVQGLEFSCVENKEDEETVKVKVKKDEGCHQDNKRDGVIQQSKPNDRCEKKISDKFYAGQVYVEKEGEENSDVKRVDEHTLRRGTSERHGGEGVEDQDNGQLNAGQNRLQEGLEQEILHQDVGVERQITEEKKTGDNEHDRQESFVRRRSAESREPNDQHQMLGETKVDARSGLCSVKEQMMGGVSRSEREVQMPGSAIQHNIKTETTPEAAAETSGGSLTRQLRDDEVNAKGECDPKADDSSSSEPQQHGNEKSSAGEEKDDERKSLLESDAKKYGNSVTSAR